MIKLLVRILSILMAAIILSPFISETRLLSAQPSQDPTAAQSSTSSQIKYVTLNDGTQLKGRLISMTDGVYVFETTSLGRINIHESSIVNISSSPAQTQNNASAQEQTDPAQIRQQAAAMQQKLATDPEIMKEISSLAQDPELMQIISDPELMKAAMSSDVEGIKNNPKTQLLLNNEKIKSLIQKISNQNGESPAQ